MEYFFPSGSYWFKCSLVILSAYSGIHINGNYFLKEFKAIIFFVKPLTLRCKTYYSCFESLTVSHVWISYKPCDFVAQYLLCPYFINVTLEIRPSFVCCLLAVTTTVLRNVNPVP